MALTVIVTLCVTVWPLGMLSSRWCARTKEEGVVISNFNSDNSSTYFNLCLNCGAVQFINKYSAIWKKIKIKICFEQNKERSSAAVTKAVKDPVKSCSKLIWYDRQNSQSYKCVRSCTGKNHDICLCLWCSSIVSFNTYTDWFLSSLAHFIGHYSTWWLVLC